jgi:hypothetical protein
VIYAKISYELILQKKFTESIIIDNTIQLLTFIEVNIIQIQPFYEVDTSLYRPKRCISTKDIVRGRYTSLGRYTTCID